MINEKCAQKYCRDDISKIENYYKAIADTAQTWELHHRLELTLDGEYAHGKEELKRLEMYYDRPYFELIFLTSSDHRILHRKGTHHSEETRRKMSVSHKGKNNSFYGKQHSEETRKKMSEAAKRRWSQHAKKENIGGENE